MLNAISFSIAQNAHGYVGADLSAVCKEAGLIAMKRLLQKDANNKSSLPLNPEGFNLELKDVQDALRKVTPSAMRAISVDIPKVTWNDIGGQYEVKQRLKEAVEWPLKYPEVQFVYHQQEVVAQPAFCSVNANFP